MNCRFVLYISLVVIILAIIVNKILGAMSHVKLKSENSSEFDLEGKYAVVVGGTSGIGLGIALTLASLKANVIIVGRSRERGEEIIRQMNAISKKSKYSFISCNCFMLKNVKECVEDITKTLGGVPLDYLVMSQGMATIQGFTPSKEEHLDQKLSLHVFSRVAFAAGLIDSLKESTDARVLSGVHGTYNNYSKDPELCKGSYSIKAAAESAGMYNDIWCDALHKIHPKISFIHAAPGFISTSWGTEMPFYIRYPVRILQGLFARSKEQCGEYMVKGMLSGKGGRFRLLDQYGQDTAQVTKIHEEAREPVFEHIMKIIKSGKSVDWKPKK